MADYSSSWRNYRRLRRIALLSLVGFVPVVLILDWMGRMPVPAKLPGYLGSAYVLFFLLAWSLFTYFHCPRCGKWFATTRWFYQRSLTTQKCVHCGLKKFSDGEERAVPTSPGTQLSC